MNKNSLIALREAIIDYLIYEKHITKEDKKELMKNLFDFLEPSKYEENAKILKRGNNEYRRVK